MGILDHVTNAKPTAGIRAVIAGVEKVGKTTLAANSPRCLLVPLEQGYGGITVHKTPMLGTYNEVIQLLDETTAKAQAGQFPFKTLAFDSATALERLIHEAVLMSDPTWARGNRKALTMESALGGYGKAYQYANELFAAFLQRCDVLATYGGINIVLTCHVFAARIVDPMSGEYDSWDLLLHSPKNQKSYGKREMLTQWADLIGFLHEPMFITKSGDKGMSMGVSANQGHVLAISRTPAYVAGNRYGAVGSIAIPKVGGWNHLAHAIYTASGIDCYNRD